MVTGDVGKWIQRIDRAGIDRAGICDDAGWLMSVAPILFDCRLELRDIDGEICRHGNDVQRFLA